MDRRRYNGSKKGGNPGAGRPTKSVEKAIVDKLSPLDDIAFNALKMGVEAGEYQFVKLFFEYRWGKPKEHTTIATDDTINVIWDEPEVFVIGGQKIYFK